MIDREEAYQLAKAQAVQAYRQLATAQALLEERHQQLTEALALVGAREPVSESVSEPTPEEQKIKPHIRNEMVWLEDAPSCGFLSCSCGYWGWYPWSGSDGDPWKAEQQQVLTTALREWVEHVKLSTTGREVS